MHAFHRTAFAAIVVLLLLFVFTGAAQAWTIQGGDAAHRGAVDSLLKSRPNITTVCEPLKVRIAPSGGQARLGEIDVPGSFWGKAFTDAVAHEVAHEIVLRRPALWDAWRGICNERGVVVPVRPGAYAWERDRWLLHGLVENLKWALYAPYYANEPDRPLLALTRDEVFALLRDKEVEP